MDEEPKQYRVDELQGLSGIKLQIGGVSYETPKKSPPPPSPEPHPSPAGLSTPGQTPGYANSPATPPLNKASTPLATPLDDAAISLLESYQHSNWAYSRLKAACSLQDKDRPSAAGVVNGMAATGIPPDLYTAALRAILVEWAALPGASLPARLQAADALCIIFGVHRDLHEQLLYRALSANEQVVPELFKQAQAIAHNRFGVARTDFSSKAAYRAWRRAALAETLAALTALQQLPEFNALLEVTILGARDLSLSQRKASSLWCCVAPVSQHISPYTCAWVDEPKSSLPSRIAASNQGSFSSRGRGSNGPQQAMVPPHVNLQLQQHAKKHGFHHHHHHHLAWQPQIPEQHTQVALGAGPNTEWHYKLQELPLSTETAELRFKVKHCHDPRGNHLSSRDRLLGRNSIRIGGLKTGLAHSLTIPLYGRRPLRSGSGGGSQHGKDPDADEDDGDDADSQRSAHVSSAGKSGGDRIVYDPEADAMHGTAGLPPRGKLSVHLRYIVERRFRIPSAASMSMASAASSDDEEEKVPAQANKRASPFTSHLNQAFNDAAAERPQGSGHNAIHDNPFLESKSMKRRSSCSEEQESGGGFARPVSRVMSKIGHSGEGLLKRVNPLSLLPGHDNQGGNLETSAALKNAEDYLHHVFHTLALDGPGNPLSSSACKSAFLNSYKHASVTLLAEPPPPPPPLSVPSPADLDMHQLVKQLASALAAVHVSGEMPSRTLHPQVRPLEQAPLPNSTNKHQRQSILQALQLQAGQARAAAGSDGLGALPLVTLPMLDVEAIGGSSAIPPATTVLVGVLLDPAKHVHLPFGQGLGVLLRFGRLFRIRSETLLLLLVQHMLEQWPQLDREAPDVGTLASHPPSHTAYCKLPLGLPGLPEQHKQQILHQLQQQLGGWHEYLQALRHCWEPLFVWYAAGTLTSDEVEGFKGCMGLFLSRSVPVLFHHYAVFKRKEGVVCFMLLLEMLGWACTWDPEKETPVPLLSEYIEGAATSRIIRSLHPTDDTLPTVIIQVTQEVCNATEDLHRDLDIQGALPGLAGFALNNCRKRYKKMAEHMGMIFKLHPGSNGQAMRALQQLEAALGRHHHHLLVNGLAVSQNPAHTEYVLQQHHQHLLQLQQQEAKGIKLPELGEKGAAKRRRWLGGEPFQLWDFEAAYTKALDQWVVTSASELAAQIQRLLAGEEWRPLSQTQRVAGSAVELQRLLNASLDNWLDAALGGGPRRRRVVGRTITACLAAVLAKYTTSFVCVWDTELERRSSFFISADMPSQPQAPGHARGNSVRIDDLLRERDSGLPEGLSRFAGGQPAQQARAMLNSIQIRPPPLHADAQLLEEADQNAMQPPHNSSPARTPPQHGRSPSMAQGGAMQNGGLHRPSPSFSPRPRMHNMAVRSMSIGHRDGPLPSASNDGMGCAFGPTPANSTPASHHGSRTGSMQGQGHIRTRSIATRDAGGARDAIAAALAAEPGICLTETMCVVRCTLQQLMEDTHDLAKVLHAALITSPPPYGGCSMESPPEGGQGSVASSGPYEPMDDVLQHPPQHRAALSALLSSANTLDVSFGAPQREGVRSLGLMGCRMMGSKYAHRDGIEANGPEGMLTYGRSRQDFVVATWCDVERAQGRVVSHLASSYTIQVRSCILNMLIAACGRKASDEPSIKILAGVLTALHDELGVMRSGLGYCAPVAGEMAGALWRATVSALQLLVLHQVGFRVLGPEEADVSRQMLISLCDMFAEEIPTLAHERGSNNLPQPRLDPSRVPNPAYFWELVEQRYLAAHAGPGTFTSVAGAAAYARINNSNGNGNSNGTHHQRSQTEGAVPRGGELDLDVLMAQELPTPHAMLPSLPPDPAIGRLLSSAYCSALLQAVTAATEDLQDMYCAQLSCIQEARLGKDAPAFVELGPQQLSLLDLMRLLRQRRRSDPTANSFATDQLKAAAAVPTQIIFGLSSHQRLVAEAKCHVAGIRLQGRLGLTQEVLCFTTLLDADLKSTTDTTFTVLLAKVNQCCRGEEPNSLLITTMDHEQYVFVNFPPGECDRMLMNIRKDTMIAGPPPGSLLGALPGSSNPPPPAPFPQGPFSRMHQRAASYSNLFTGGALGDLSGRPGPLQQQQQQQQQQLAQVQQQGVSPASAAANAVRNVLSNYTNSPQLKGVGIAPATGTPGAGPSSTMGTPGEASLEPDSDQLRGVNGMPHSGSPRFTPSRHAHHSSNGSMVEHPSPVTPTLGSSMPMGTGDARAQEEQASQGSSLPPPAPGREHLSPPVMVAPCHLAGKLFHTDGTLLLFRDRIDFVASREGSPPGVAEGGLLLHTIPLSAIETVTQKTSFLAGNPLLVIQLEPNPNKPDMPTLLTFGGITDALLASFKQCISDLATSS